jgi:CheY-like chemotaxis protein
MRAMRESLSHVKQGRVLRFKGTPDLAKILAAARNQGLIDIHVVAVTSYAMKGDREKALAAGCVGYITKPIDKTTFLEDIVRFLGLAKVKSPLL